MGVCGRYPETAVRLHGVSPPHLGTVTLPLQKDLCKMAPTGLGTTRRKHLTCTLPPRYIDGTSTHSTQMHRKISLPPTLSSPCPSLFANADLKPGRLMSFVAFLRTHRMFPHRWRVHVEIN